ncbi:response regulator [Deinococcus sonorensis]|uniref:Response regulator n=2 Tax=Deinococcus sonorensis TaxID=309891 RepID=A0AAU7U569_9DEIO
MPGTASRPHHPGTVMLVEDLTAIRTLQRFLLHRSGLEVVECADLPEAESALSRFAPGVVVLDLNLPGGHGLNLLEHIDRSVTNVLVMSSMAQQHTIETSRVRGDAYLSKPFDPAVFVDTVQRLLP